MISDENSREEMMAKVPKEVFVATCIGCGLQLAMQVCQTNYRSSSKAIKQIAAIDNRHFSQLADAKGWWDHRLGNGRQKFTWLSRHF